jgi:hypothetical protein
MDHVAFRMPVLSASISGYFNELFKDGLSTPVTSHSKARRVVEVTIYFTVMFVVTVFRTKYGVA